MPRIIAATLALALGLGANPGCAHRQVTNREVAIGAVAVVGVTALVWLAIVQCRKSAAFCDNSPAGQ